ncbi:hypothetical protein ACJX0J_040633 [Zea mays]
MGLKHKGMELEVREEHEQTNLCYAYPNFFSRGSNGKIEADGTMNMTQEQFEDVDTTFYKYIFISQYYLAPDLILEHVLKITSITTGFLEFLNDGVFWPISL